MKLSDKAANTEEKLSTRSAVTSRIFCTYCFSSLLCSLVPGIYFSQVINHEVGVRKNRIIAPFDSTNVIVNVVVSVYTPTKTVPIKKQKLAPCFLPSCKSPPIKPEKASKLISYTFNILDKDKIRPVTTPTVEPTAAPPTNANEITIYRENTFSKAIPYIV